MSTAGGDDAGEAGPTDLDPLAHEREGAASELGSRVYRVVREGQQSRLVELAAGAVTIGRAPDAHIRIDDARVSRAHATIVREGARVTLSDHGSRNGTKLNG